MLNVVKHLGCVYVDVHEILRFAQQYKIFFANQFCFDYNYRNLCNLW